MLPKEILDSWTCALNTTTNPHFLQQAIQLSCGHSICKKCFKDKNENFKIKCGLCFKMSHLYFNDHNVHGSIAVQSLVALHLDDLFKVVHDRYKEALKDLKGFCFY
jgi:hypothetical protein